jgi:hypothetical protein
MCGAMIQMASVRGEQERKLLRSILERVAPVVTGEEGT